MSRNVVDVRRSIQPYYMRFDSTQYLLVSSASGNNLNGLSGCTLIHRCRILKSVNGGNMFSAPTDGTSQALCLKNTNNTLNTLRVGYRIGGVTGGFDIPAGNFVYTKNVVYTFGLRYTGSAIEFWSDGVMLYSSSISGAFASTPNAWNINNANGGTTAVEDIFFSRAWGSSLSDTNMVLAMKNQYTTGTIVNVDFSEGTGTPTDRAVGASITGAGGGVGVWRSQARISSI